MRSLCDIKIWSYVKYHGYWFQYLLDFMFNWFHYLVDFYVCLMDLWTLKPLSCKLRIYGRHIKETCLNQREISLDFFKLIYSNRLIMPFLNSFFCYPLLSIFLVIYFREAVRMKLVSLKLVIFRVVFLNSAAKEAYFIFA